MNQTKKRILSLIKNGALDAAVTVAVDAARRNPAIPEYFLLLAQAEEIAGYTKAAIKSVSKAIALAPHEPVYRFQRGRLHLQINAAADALSDLNGVLETLKMVGNADYIRAVVTYRDEALRRVQLDQRRNPLQPGLRQPPRQPVRHSTAHAAC